LTGSAEGANDGHLRHARKCVLDFLRIREGESTLPKIRLIDPPGMTRQGMFRKIALVATLAAVAVLALWASIGGAAAPAPSLTVLAVPPAVTSGENVLGVLKFQYPTGSSPTTITGVYVKVDIPAGSVFKPTPLSSSNCTLQSAGWVRCDLGNVRAGETRRISVVVSAPSADFTIAGTAFWNENVNGSNPLPNNQVGPVDSNTVNVPTGTDIQGKCQTVTNTSPLTLSTTSSTTQQRTLLSISKQAENFPCTPASAGVEAASPPSGACGGANCTTQTSFVFFPSLLQGSAATVILDFPGSILPSGTTPKKFVLYQLLGGPQGVVVADCGTTPNASPDTCIVSRAKYGTSGVELVLSVLGSLIDPRYIG
jgi:hypothetical protein